MDRSATEHQGEKFVDRSFAEESLAGVVFEDCVFEKCDFRECDLTGARFIGCDFASCDLSNAKPRGARFRETSFLECKLLGLQWVQLDDLTNPKFKDCNLGYGNLAGLKLKKAVFAKCRLHDADFSDTDLSEADLRESDFLNARFHATTLVKADFRSAINYSIDPLRNKIRGARFSLPEAQSLLAGLGISIEDA